MLFDQNRVDAIIHNWKNQVFSNERIHSVPRRHSTCLKPPIGGFRNLASRVRDNVTERELKFWKKRKQKSNSSCSLHVPSCEKQSTPAECLLEQLFTDPQPSFIQSPSLLSFPEHCTLVAQRTPPLYRLLWKWM